MENAQASDKEIGFGVLFGALGMVGALVMLLGSFGGDKVLAGWGFAAAMLAGTLAIVAVHVYE